MKFDSVAKKAIKKYDIKVKTIRFLTEETNVFYEILSESNEKYVLKIYQEESSNINDNIAEHFLLKVIQEKTQVRTARVIKNETNETVTKIKYPNKRGYKRTALYEYLEGRNIDGIEDLKYFRKMGQILASMHLATKNLNLPDDVNPKKYDKVFYFEGEEAIYHKPRYKKYLTKDMIEILDELIPYINIKLYNLYIDENPQLIHGDLNPWNIKVHNDEIRIFDFEEALFGLPIHDIAIFLYYYYNHQTLKYYEIKKEFLSGYSEITELPNNVTDANLEMIMIARRINFFNYVLYIRKNPKKYIETSFPKIREYYFSYK
ncbi:phosphotransferase enzyme family protein [Candidatus Izemoplasma sp. B36]|uniref:phosphotransferase enzyme family protein n=1 Tax=Candidatus Izemoplasma sp. B36 TaxID=3242468 RepID=UPI0035578975